MNGTTIWMTFVIFFVAMIYSAIGQGGGTGYLAVMAVGGLTASQIRPTALALNILVSALSGWKFKKAGRFSPAVFWPATLSGFPAVMIGAMIDLPPGLYKMMVAVILLFAAQRLVQSTVGGRHDENPTDRTPNRIHVCLAGALIGFISGLTGIGGGIFLSPIMVLSRWSDARNAAGTSAIYTFVNSVAGLTVIAGRTHELPPELPIWLVVATTGAWIGSEFGVKGLSERATRRLLALALACAAIRSAWSAFSGI